MAIVVDNETRLVVQGLTGSEGTFHTLRNFAYGTKVVAGVTPGKGGQDVEGIPVFDTVARAVAETGANTSMIFVPPRFAAEICTPGRVGLVSRSGTLVYQIVHELTQRGIGQSTCVGMGGDPVHGIGFLESLERFEADPDTDLVVMIGEIGGDDEERASRFVSERMSKPVVGYIAGFTAPPGKRMGHAGAIITGSSGTAQAKSEALEAAGVRVGRNPTEAADLAVAAVKER